MSDLAQSQLNAAVERAEKVQVSVSTTAGLYPEEGYQEIPPHQKVSVVLKAAALALHLTSTDGWLVTVSDDGGLRQVDPARSYLENHLQGRVELDWGPPEGGGG